MLRTVPRQTLQTRFILHVNDFSVCLPPPCNLHSALHYNGQPNDIDTYVYLRHQPNLACIKRTAQEVRRRWVSR
jgi:hypothetical protein